MFLVANEYLFNDIDEWNNFENSLGEINPNTINDIEADEHLKWEEEDFSEKNIHSFTDAISWNFEFIREGLNRLFPKWISKAYIPTTEEARELLLQLRN